MKYRQYIAIVSVALLSACSSNTVKDTLGLNRSAPDEFRVVSRPPLSVPPQFTLRPPASSEVSPGQLPASKQAESMVLGKTSGGAVTAGAPATAATTDQHAKSNKAASNAESQFLKNAGADKADPKVRDVIVEEKYALQDKQETSHWWNPFSWGSVTPEKKDPLVDAKKESDRIKTNEDTGQPVTTGNTPEVKARDTGVLGRIFGY